MSSSSAGSGTHRLARPIRASITRARGPELDRPAGDPTLSAGPSLPTAPSAAQSPVRSRPGSGPVRGSTAPPSTPDEHPGPDAGPQPAFAQPGSVLHAVARVVRHRWPLLLVATILGAGLGFAGAQARTPQYQSTSSVFFSVDRGQTVTEFSAGVVFARDIVPSYAEIVTQPVVLQPVIDSLRLDSTPAQVARQVAVTTPADTLLLTITVSDPSASRAAALANGISTQLATTAGALSPRGSGENAPSLRVSAVAPAIQATTPESVNPILLVVVGGLLGLVLGVLGVGLVEAVRRPIRHREDVAPLTSAPVLGEIAREPGFRPGLDATDGEAETGVRAESLRFLRANLGLLGRSTQPRFLLVTSASPQEGRTGVAVGLARTMSATSRRTLLIDADLHSSSVSGPVSGADPGSTAGLSAVLRGASTFDAAVEVWRDTTLSVLPAGTVPDNPGELLASERMSALLDEALARFDLVIIDTPPLLELADAATLAALTGDVLLVARAGVTRRRHLAEAIERLDGTGAGIRGVVLNDVAVGRPWYRRRTGAGSPPRSRPPVAAPVATDREGTPNLDSAPDASPVGLPDAGAPEAEFVQESRPVDGPSDGPSDAPTADPEKDPERVQDTAVADPRAEDKAVR